jgi:hypothetical protein
MAVKKSQKKEVKYIVVNNYDFQLFLTEVNKFLSEGYEPVGGICTAVSPNQQYKVLFSQALILNI